MFRKLIGKCPEAAGNNNLHCKWLCRDGCGLQQPLQIPFVAVVVFVTHL
jgi:hypothetical protein